MVDRYDIENDFAAQKEFDATQEGRILSLASQNAALEQRLKELEEEIVLLEGEVEAYQRSGDFKLDDDTAENKRLRAENERLQTRLKEQAEQYQELIASLHRQIALAQKMYPFLRDEGGGAE
jgi:predicted RNase H-like nuclease (RuvC/YqgF family)